MVASSILTPIDVQIGVVPVISVYVGFNGSISVGFETGVTQETTWTSGISYTAAAGWKPISDRTTTVNTHGVLGKGSTTASKVPVDVVQFL
jgi:hypothetical protein